MGMGGNGNGNDFMGMGGNGNRNSPSCTPLLLTLALRQKFLALYITTLLTLVYTFVSPTSLVTGIHFSGNRTRVAWLDSTTVTANTPQVLRILQTSQALLLLNRACCMCQTISRDRQRGSYYLLGIGPVKYSRNFRDKTS